MSVSDSRRPGRSTRKAGSYLIPVEQIERAILTIRGKRVMLDRDLAKLYGVTTKALNQAVKRNRERFPADFMFQLTIEDKDQLVTDCDRLSRLKHSSSPPRVFTEHGAVMLASVLSSKRAVEVSVFVVRAFVRMRRILADHRKLALKLAELESRLDTHDHSIRSLMAAMRQLMQPPGRTKVLSVGFKGKKEK